MNSSHEDLYDEVWDVVVVGTGFAGLTAAIEAKNGGASVCILEKMSACGGNSIISDGGIAAPNTSLQNKFGIEDSPEAMYEDMMQAGSHLNHPLLVKTLVTNANAAFEWSRDYLGVEYLDKVDIFGGHQTFRCYTAKGRTGGTIIKKLMEKIETLGIKIYFRHCFTDFIINDEGRVEGIIVDRGEDQDQKIGIKRGVVLATGGFGSDVDFRSAQDPRLTSIIETTNKPFATAQALKATLRIGAMPVHLSYIQLGPWACPDEKGYGVGPLFSEYVVFQYGIIVDPSTGHRFVNELADRKTVSDQMLMIGHPCIGIADRRGVENSGWSIEKCLKKGIVQSFDSLQDLAEFYQMDLDGLKGTIADFNQNFVEEKVDPFGKPLLKNASPIMAPPFYGIRLWPKVHHTMGGIGINTQAEVIDLEGKVIKGLYAAGEVCGGIHGASRLGSCAITECLVFGRIAGKQVAGNL